MERCIYNYCIGKSSRFNLKLTYLKYFVCWQDIKNILVSNKIIVSSHVWTNVMKCVTGIYYTFIFNSCLDTRYCTYISANNLANYFLCRQWLLHITRQMIALNCNTSLWNGPMDIHLLYT